MLLNRSFRALLEGARLRFRPRQSDDLSQPTVGVVSDVQPSLNYTEGGVLLSDDPHASCLHWFEADGAFGWDWQEGTRAC